MKESGIGREDSKYGIEGSGNKTPLFW